MQTQRILVRIPQWLGDAVVSTVFLKRLKARHPAAQISVLVPDALAAIFDSHPSVYAVIPIPTGRKGVFSVGAELRSRQFDTAYILPRSFRTALEIWLARIPTRIGFSGDFRGFLLTQPLRYEPRLLYAHRYLRLIGEDELSLSTIRPYFPAEEPRRNESEALGRAVRDAEGPLLGVAPASIAPARTWSPDRFAHVANQFQKDHGGTVILFGSAKERARTAVVRQAIQGPAIDTAGQLNLAELGWTVQRCHALVANDSGLMHVASCFRVPTVVLFGASDPVWATPPWGKFVGLQHKEISCVPCLKNECVLVGNHKYDCLKAISAAEVGEALEKIIKSP